MKPILATVSFSLEGIGHNCQQHLLLTWFQQICEEKALDSNSLSLYT